MIRAIILPRSILSTLLAPAVRPFQPFGTSIGYCGDKGIEGGGPRTEYAALHYPTDANVPWQRKRDL